MITGVEARVAMTQTLSAIFSVLPSPAVGAMRRCNGFGCVIASAEHGAAPEAGA
ncbi:MAG: hypothetical protein ACTS6J_14300 [Burkholderiales bacterium]